MNMTIVTVALMHKALHVSLNSTIFFSFQSGRISVRVKNLYEKSKEHHCFIPSKEQWEWNALEIFSAGVLFTWIHCKFACCRLVFSTWLTMATQLEIFYFLKFYISLFNLFISSFLVIHLFVFYFHVSFLLSFVVSFFFKIFFFLISFGL